MSVKHGMRNTRVYRIWCWMLCRCRDEENSRYGGRGIRVCDSWHTFENFFADMGHPPSPQHSIDRRDVNGNYEPGNCRWATRKEQGRNTTRNTILAHDGISATIAEWSERTNIKPATICVRLANGWSVECTLTTPVQVWRYGADKPWAAVGMSKSAWYRARVLERLRP